MADIANAVEITDRNANRFPLAMRLMHWSMALLMIGLIASGLYMASVPLDAPDKFDLYPWHRAFGTVLFVAVLIRIWVRWTHRTRVPRGPATIPASHRAIAGTVQMFFYFAMIVVPILGYVASSAVPEFPGIPALGSIWFFGAELPLAPVEKNYDTTVIFITAHKYLGYAVVVALAAHIGGTLKHRFLDAPENDVLSRML